jgi:hypothetical protein
VQEDFIGDDGSLYDAKGIVEKASRGFKTYYPNQSLRKMVSKELIRRHDYASILRHKTQSALRPPQCPCLPHNTADAIGLHVAPLN